MVYLTAQDPFWLTALSPNTLVQPVQWSTNSGKFLGWNFSPWWRTYWKASFPNLQRSWRAPHPNPNKWVNEGVNEKPAGAQDWAQG